MAQRRITVKAVAERLSLHQVHVSKVLNGYRGASVEFRAGLSEMLGLPEGQLFNPLPSARPRHSPKAKGAA
jgi:transcriptional regulator with XRE-family HTH domain